MHPRDIPIIYAIRETYESTLLSSYFVIISWTQLQGTNFHNICKCILTNIWCATHTLIFLCLSVSWKSNIKKKDTRTRRHHQRVETVCKKSLCIWTFYKKKQRTHTLHHMWISLFFIHATSFHNRTCVCIVQWKKMHTSFKSCKKRIEKTMKKNNRNCNAIISWIMSYGF